MICALGVKYSITIGPAELIWQEAEEGEFVVDVTDAR